jgi:DNA-binding transcriptional regulator YiaG
MSGMELKAWRKRLGLTQAEAAAMLEVSAFTLSAWEIGRVKIRQSGMLKLACRMVEMQLTQSSEHLSQSRLA